MAIKAFIFDLDGVITDTAEYHYRAWQRLAREENIPFSRTQNEKLRGVSRRESLLLLLDGRSVHEDKLQAMMDRKNRYYQEYLQQLTPMNILPGVLKLLQALQEKGFLLAVASASKNARTVIDKLKIKTFFDTIADGYTVRRTKPAPDLFLFTARALGVAPPCCVVIEDAMAGIEAAHKAGMIALGIGPYTRVSRAHITYPNVAAIKLEEVLNLKTA